MLSNLLSAISLINSKIEFNLTKIDQSIWSEDTYSIISNQLYIQNLQLMYDLNLLIFIENKPFFIENKVNYAYQGIWAESRWYWFGYWKLHIGHVECQYFINLLDNNVREYIGIVTRILTIGKVGGVARLVAGLLYANSAIMSKWDRGNGIWIGIYGIIPNLGWGSD